MIRKLPWGFLLWFAHLTILPGCQHIPYFGSSADEDPKSICDHAQAQPTATSKSKRAAEEKQINWSKATSVENNTTETNFLRAFAYSGGSIDFLFPENSARDADGQKKRNEGVSSIITLEPGQDPATPKNVGVNIQVPPPQVAAQKKSEYEPIVMALQRMLEGRHQDAIKFLSAYENDKQELLLRLLPPLATIVKKRVEDLSTQEVTVLIGQYQATIDDLRPRSELIVSRMCYCEEVRGYAWYRALPDNHTFLTGTESRIGELVQLYVELKNIASEPTKEGEFVTKLRCSLELVDSTGKKVWSKSFDGNETTLRRSARLNDFYSRYGFYVPAVPAGTYQLTLRIADETNPQKRRVAQKSLDFRVTPVANQPPLH
jgi:hypothetical protein